MLIIKRVVTYYVIKNSRLENEFLLWMNNESSAADLCMECRAKTRTESRAECRTESRADCRAKYIVEDGSV